MAIPDYQTCMLPLLKVTADKKEHSLREAVDILAEQFSLSEDELKQLLPSGQTSVFVNRVGWARSYMKQAGLISPTRRGFFEITERGLDVLANKPKEIDVKFFYEKDETVSQNNNEKTPAEALESAYENLKAELIDELLQQIKSSPPRLFEKIVVELIVKMGYGGSRKDAGRAIGRSGDEGIDGIINEDRLGLDIIYIQAKRWENTVSRPEIQKFAGALQGQRARKGIFITTSSFSKEAIEYVSRIDNKIVLIDGEQLAQFMFENNVGFSTVANYEAKKIDTDYFMD
jgi:restriction system protein